MKSTITVLAVLMSIGSAIAVRAEVTNISNQQKITIIGNTTTVVDRQTTVVNKVKTSTKNPS